MDYLEIPGPDAVASLALDEALLLEAEEGHAGEMLRIWEWPSPVVVLGSSCRLQDDVHEDACRADNIPILRRSSGGGTVLWGPGCLLYSLVLRLDRHPALTEIRPSYAWILGQIIEAIGVPGIEQQGISDLALAGRKLSGNAQQRKRDHLLHHGTLLYDFDLSQAERYLKLPPRQPDYRVGRSHTQFLCTIPLPGDILRHRLRDHWQAHHPRTTWPEEIVRRLRQEKYDDPTWIRRL